MKKYEGIPAALLTTALALIICTCEPFSPFKAYAFEGRERNATASYAEKKELRESVDKGFEFDSEEGCLLIKSEAGLEAVTGKDSGLNFLDIKKIVIGDDIKELSKPVFAGLPNLRELDLNKVEKVTGFSFTLCENLERINAPELRTAGEHAFSNNNALKELYLPKLESTEDAAFYNCTALYHADMPRLKDIGMMSFASCGELREFDMKAVVSIEGYAFAEDRKLSLVMPESAPSISGKEAINDVYELCIPETSEGYDSDVYSGFPGKISIIADDLKIPEYAIPKKGQEPVTEYEMSGFGHGKYKVHLKWSPQSETFEENTKYRAEISLEDTGREHFTLMGLDTYALYKDNKDKIENISFDTESLELTAEFYPLITENAGDENPETPELPETPESSEDSEPSDKPGMPEVPETPQSSDSGENDSNDTDKNNIAEKNTNKGVGKSEGLELAISGTWTCEGEGASAKWRFYAYGRQFKDEWAYLINPYTDDPRYRASWFRFDASGIMLTGTYRDEAGNTWYLNPISDGTLGRLET